MVYEGPLKTFSGAVLGCFHIDTHKAGTGKTGDKVENPQGGPQADRYKRSDIRPLINGLK